MSENENATILLEKSGGIWRAVRDFGRLVHRLRKDGGRITKHDMLAGRIVFAAKDGTRFVYRRWSENDGRTTIDIHMERRSKKLPSVKIRYFNTVTIE